MPLLISENEVAQLITMPEAITAVEDAFRSQTAYEGASNQVRTRFFLPKGVMHQMSAALPICGVMGTKTYTSFATRTRFWIMLYSTENGDLLAIIESNKLSQMRTGAATGIAARHMAREDSITATMIGCGWQARGQAEALLIACPRLHKVYVHCRSLTRRERFCREMTRTLGIHFHPMESAEEAVRSSKILITITTANNPIIKAEWLSQGHFIAAVGANRLSCREIDENTVGCAGTIVVDDIAQARTEAGELIFAYEKRRMVWERVHPLSEIIAGHRPGRTSQEEITLFKSLGIALEDVAVAAVVYEKARAAGIGRCIAEE